MINTIWGQRLGVLAASAIVFTFWAVPVRGQVELTLDGFISMALRDEADALRQIYLQNEINQLDYLLSQTSYFPSVSVSVNGPLYSKSVSPVTQPDGSICYRRVNSMNESLSVNFSVPINATGGSLSLSSGISAYKHFSANMSTLSLSMNYCRLSFSQPLNFYSENKWGEKLSRLSYKQAMIENSDSYADECKESAIMFFHMVVCQAKDSLLQSELKLYNLIKSRVEREVSLGRSLTTELEEVRLKCEDVVNQITDNEIERRGYVELIMSKYGVFADDVALWRCPDFPMMELCIDSMEVLALSKLDAMAAYSFENHKKNMERLRKSRWGTPSLSANMGLSSSANDFDNLKNNVDRDYGAGVNFSLSITGLSSNKKEMRKAQLQNESLRLDQERRKESVLINLRKDLRHMDVLEETYHNNRARELLLVKKRNSLLEKQKLGRTLFEDIENVLSQIFKARISQVENIRDAFLLKQSLLKRITF